jgi:predicted  nucleic acid-binding Zn-ribbon protein
MTTEIEKIEEELKNIPKLLKKKEKELQKQLKKVKKESVNTVLQPIKDKIVIKKKELRDLEKQLAVESKKLGTKVVKKGKRNKLTVSKEEIAKIIKSGVDTISGLSKELSSTSITVKSYLKKIGLKYKVNGKGRGSKILLA